MNLVHRRQNLSNCTEKSELGQSREQELTGRLQPKQGCQSDNLIKEIVSRQAINLALTKLRLQTAGVQFLCLNPYHILKNSVL